MNATFMSLSRHGCHIHVVAGGAGTSRTGDIDLCLIHLGGTRIAGILLTMDDRQGVQALRTVGPRRAIPVHYDDYTLFKSPLSDFRRAAEKAGLPTELHNLGRGDSYRLGLDARALACHSWLSPAAGVCAAANAVVRVCRINPVLSCHQEDR
ncbi:MAG TPA: hypothetical protein VFQ68_38180 [Streptosporangiaceae bacterium]|nr:hypothetical protein [Streptosporangiaceae bacterium]